MSDRDATAALIGRLRSHYIADSADRHARKGGEFAAEVSINGGWGNGNRADALYAGFTSSSGRILVGHEVKVSRADWRAELAKIGKADYWADACHAWYIVAPSTEIVPVEELPARWGLMTPPARASAKRFKIVKAAEVKTDHNPPWEAIRSFMARLDTLQHHDTNERLAAMLGAERARLEDSYETRMTAQLDPRDAQRLRNLAELEQHLGYTIDLFDYSADSRVAPEVLASAIGLAKSVRSVPARAREISYVRQSLNRILPALDDIEKTLTDFKVEK